MCNITPPPTHTHKHTTVLLLSGFCLGQPGWASTRRNIHPLTYHGHQSSLICFVHLIRSIASSLFSLGAWQSFSTISASFLWCTSWPGTLHFILQILHHSYITVFRKKRVYLIFSFANVDQFSKFHHWNCAMQLWWRLPPHLNYISVLPHVSVYQKQPLFIISSSNSNQLQ